jgi:hypothetical protein
VADMAIVHVLPGAPPHTRRAPVRTPFYFEILTETRAYGMCTDTEEARFEWVSALERLLVERRIASPVPPRSPAVRISPLAVTIAVADESDEDV